jgi:GAF domain-containing protein
VEPGEESKAGAAPPRERHAEDGDLAASLRRLSVLPADRLSLTGMLTRVARYAVQAIPGADGAGVTLVAPGRADIAVSTDAFVARADAAQSALGEGPSISAARDGRTVISGSLGGDPRWPRFGHRAVRLGVHSALSLQLTTPYEVVGALNVYAHAKHVFHSRPAELAELFALPAAIAVHNTRVLEDSRRLAAQLQTALDDRMVIERAVGIVMSRSGLHEGEVLAQLVRLSQHKHVKLLQIARDLVDEAVRQARARPPR